MLNLLASKTLPLHARIQNARILIVEDDPVNQMLIESILKHHGFHNLQLTNNGQEGLKCVQQSQPDIILLDLLMPEMNGFEFCKILRANPLYQNIPILVQTGLEAENERVSALNIGASDLITKPIHAEELIARVRIHLEKRLILEDLQLYHQRMEADLANARELQNILMPNAAALQQIQEQHYIECASLFEPSSTIGGDYWGIKSLGNGKLAIYLGDFTGHGVTAALNVFRLHTLMETIDTAILSEPSICLAYLSKELKSFLPVELFATMFYGVIDGAQNQLVYAAAGSHPPLLLRNGSEPSYEMLAGSGVPLSVGNNLHYSSYSTPFHENDRLMVYSDALMETPNTHNMYLAPDALAQTLLSMPPESTSADATLSLTNRVFRAFIAGDPDDDLTILVLRRTKMLNVP